MYRVIYKWTKPYQFCADYARNWFWVVEKRVWFFWFRVWECPAAYDKATALKDAEARASLFTKIQAKQKDVTYVGS